MPCPTFSAVNGKTFICRHINPKFLIIANKLFARLHWDIGPLIFCDNLKVLKI